MKAVPSNDLSKWIYLSVTKREVLCNPKKNDPHCVPVALNGSSPPSPSPSFSLLNSKVAGMEAI